ncbi:MAG: hypothetical protein HYU33_04735, partial [Candidatus Omnitrophica bacterium]|nr:hypothetical protein [Candidatus Omnitrophota bacterium]
MAIDRYFDHRMSTFSRLRRGEFSRKVYKDESIRAYYKLMEDLTASFQEHGGIRCFIYPFRGADVVPLMVGPTFSLNTDPLDLTSGLQMMQRIFGADHTAIQRILKAELSPEPLNARDLKNYVEFVQRYPGPYVLILKGFKEHYRRADPPSHQFINSLLHDVLREGDRILILDSMDMSFQEQIEEAGFLLVVSQAGGFTGYLRHSTDDGIKEFIFPGTIAVFEKRKALHQTPASEIQTPEDPITPQMQAPLREVLVDGTPHSSYAPAMQLNGGEVVAKALWENLKRQPIKEDGTVSVEVNGRGVVFHVVTVEGKQAFI